MENNISADKFNSCSNTITRGKGQLTQADREFLAWLKNNAKEGVLYTMPSGRLVNGSDIISSKKAKNIIPLKPKDLKMKPLLTKDTVKLTPKKTVPAQSESLWEFIAKCLKQSNEDKEFFAWLAKNVREGMSYTTPSGHIINGTDYIRGRNMLESRILEFAKKINAKDIMNIIKRA